MIVEILSVKVIGLCSKHQSKNMPTPIYKNGKVIPDKELECIGCNFEENKK